jgi:hypothetical protein
MSFSAVLDVALGLVLVYLLFSVAASKLNETLVSRLGLRADGVEKGLRRILHGGDEAAALPPLSRVTADALQSLELIKNESAPGRRPAYIRPRTFALAMYDLLAPPLHELVVEMQRVAGGDAASGVAPSHEALAILDDEDLDDTERITRLRTALIPARGRKPAFEVDQPMLGALTRLLEEAKAHMANDPDDPLGQVRVAIDNLPDDHPAKRPLLRFIKDAENDREKLLRAFEGWFNGVMARMTGWYKRKVQWFILGFALLLTIAFNVDSIAIAGNLYRDGGTRQAVAAAAIAQSTAKTPDQTDDAIRSARSLSIPIGWVLHREEPSIKTYDGRHVPRRFGDWFVKILGMFLTVGALSFGAPFWFDVLGKLANLRNNGQKPEAALGTSTKAPKPAAQGI